MLCKFSVFAWEVGAISIHNQLKGGIGNSQHESDILIKKKNINYLFSVLVYDIQKEEGRGLLT